MRVVNRPVAVETAAECYPLSFDYYGLHEIKQILDFWLEAGEWWIQEQEKSFYRVITRQEGIYELCYHHKDDAWVLTRVFD